MKETYLESVRLIERLHRRFLDVIKAELDRLGVQDINNVQVLILTNIGEEKLTVGELTIRGYYLGSNVSYNVKKLTEAGYLLQEKSEHDKRQTRVFLTEKGLDVVHRMEKLYEHQANELRARVADPEQISNVNKLLHQIERFWGQYVPYMR